MDLIKPANVLAPRSTFGAAYSALVGKVADRPIPRLLRPIAYRAFASAVGADLAEVELSLTSYPSLGDFFARRLRSGLRPLATAPHAVVAPCDGVVAACGTVERGMLLQAKGRSYQLAELLACQPEIAVRFEGGAYVTIYLSPRDYHRVHSPVSGRLVSYDYLPGALWPVNPRIADRRDGLLARNERVVMTLSTATAGWIAVVMVGAAGVGSIELAHAAGWPGTRELRAVGEHRRLELSRAVARGDELGAFRLGSTVVAVFERARLDAAGEVRCGRAIGEQLT